MVIASKPAYEETRQKRLEENRMRMEQLNINTLTKELHALKPSPDFVEPMGKARARSYNYGRRDLSNRVYASVEDKQYAMQRAEDLESGLDRNIPRFVKLMLQSHVTGGFWLGLPRHFCKEHLPDNDVHMTLLDERGDESQTKYMGKKNGLSAGWRGFAIEHELVDGDVLIFQLIDPATFKVYIIRVNERVEKDE